MEEFRNAEQTEEGIKLAEAESARLDEAKYDWSDPEDVNKYHRDRRRAERMRKLDRLVPDRVCPCCKEKRMGSRSWVIDGDVVMCRSCYFSE